MNRDRSIRIWLWLGVAMVFVQIILGGITRLTGSGLSITKWDIVTGVVPPLNEQEWNHEFSLYQQTPQYHKINRGMSLHEFKFIYFWEYFHRIWARSIGFVFTIPFFYFLIRKKLDRKLLRQLGVAVLLGLVVAMFGWIMVASGLVNRPWVNAYKLTIHLNLALLLYSWLFWIALGSKQVETGSWYPITGIRLLTGLIILQLILGGLMSGMKAGLYYPTWPDMYGAFFPKEILQADIWNAHYFFTEYERGPVPGLVQFFHRMTAYVIFIVVTIIYWKSIKYNSFVHFRQGIGALFVAVLIQLGLGILTVINCKGYVPLFYGVAHQAMAIVVLSLIVYLNWLIKQAKPSDVQYLSGLES